MSTPAIDQIIRDARERVRLTHHCEPPAESVILALATEVHLSRKLGASEKQAKVERGNMLVAARRENKRLADKAAALRVLCLKGGIPVTD